MRKFSVGYNGSDAQEFMDILSKYGNLIESIYFGNDEIFWSHHSTYYNKGYEKNLKCLLQINKQYKMFLALNNVATYIDNPQELRKQVRDKIVPFIIKNRVDGVIIASYTLGNMIRECLPDILIDTSCNCFQNNIREMNLWNEKIGIHYFNPPREILRMPNKLKELHNCGFKLKCLVNESCLFGCPTSLEHQGKNTRIKPSNIQCNIKSDKIVPHCMLGDLANIFRSNWILPRWLEILEPYVDVFKLTTRSVSNEQLKEILDAYLNERDDINILKIIVSGTSKMYSKINDKVQIMSKDIPDKLLYCECKHCNTTCFVCSNLCRKLDLKRQISNIKL